MFLFDRKVNMYPIFNKFETTVHEFNASSDRDIADLRKLMLGAPELSFVEVSENWIKFQDNPYTTHPDKSVTIYPRDDNRFSRADIKTILKVSTVFGEASTIAQIERRLAGYRLDAGAVFAFDAGSVSLLGNTFYALSRDASPVRR